MNMLDLQRAYSRLANAYYAAMSRGAFAPGDDAYFALAGDTAPMLNLERERFRHRKIFGVRLADDSTVPVGVVVLHWQRGESDFQIAVGLDVGGAHGSA